MHIDSFTEPVSNIGEAFDSFNERMKEFEKEIEGKDGYIQDVITIPNNKWMVYYADNSGMTTRTNTKVIPKL